MSKPRWIDAGVFRTLRTATRARKLAVVVGPLHGTAQISSREQLKALGGEIDRAALASDARFKSSSDAGLARLFALKPAAIATTALCDALVASAPADQSPRSLGPDGKGLVSVWDRKDTAIVRLAGSPEEPATLVLTGKDRKVLAAPDSRYQKFLRAAFQRTVLFTGFALDDPDLAELLADVGRCFNGHVPPNLALVAAGSTDPSTALRASMHFGTGLIEFPPELSPAEALAELAAVLEDLEVPRPATGDPPRGFAELDQAARDAVPVVDALGLELFDRGDSAGWPAIKAAADAPREASAAIRDFVLGPVAPGLVRIALVRGRPGEGKSTLLRRVAWDLAEAGERVFWRGVGIGVPDRYVPAGVDGARAIFVCDDAHELDNLPSLLNYLAAHGEGKARFVLGAEADEWERSGLDHRIRRTSEMLDVSLAAPTAGEATAIAEVLARRGRLAPELDVSTAAARMITGDRCLMDRMAEVRGVGSVKDAVARRLAALDGHADAALLRRAYLAAALVHRHGISLGRAPLAAVLGLQDSELDSRVLGPLDMSLVPAGAASVRTRHPVVAAAACELLAPDFDTRDAMAEDLLRSMQPGSVSDETVLHRPSELIRALRHGQIAPLALEKLFAAGEDAAGNDVNYWYDRGRFDSGFSRWEPALACFERALLRTPGDAGERDHNASVHACRARCLASLHRRKEALSEVNDGLRLNPRDPVLLRLEEKLGGRRGRPAPGGPRRQGAGGGEGGPGAGPGGRGGRGGPGGGRGGPGGGGPGGGERRRGPGGERPARRGPPTGAPRA